MIYLYIVLGLIFWLIIGYLLTNMINQVFKPRFKWQYEEEKYYKHLQEKNIIFKIKKRLNEKKKIIF